MKTSVVTIYDGQEHLSLWAYTRKNLHELVIYRYAFIDFVSSALKRRYRRSVLGFFWALVNPLLNLAIIAIVFSIVFKMDIREFGRYVFSGLVPWIFLSNSFVLGCQSLVSGEMYLKKVHLPKLMFPLVAVTAESINFLFSIISIYIILLFIGARVSWVMIALPLAVLLIFLFSLGIVIILSTLNVYFRDTVQLTQVFMTAFFYMVPIVYPLEQVPPEFLPLITYNPFYQFINLFRALVFDLRFPSLVEWAIPSGIALLTLLIGLFVLVRKDQDIIFRL